LKTDLVRQYPHLWGKSNPSYKDIIAVENAWKTISSNMSYSGMYYEQCPDEIVPDKSTSTTLRNPSLALKHDSAGSLLLKTNQLNRVYM
jgi:hypothetical protein